MVNVPAPPSPTPLRAPNFTVGSALRWPGHDCLGDLCCFAPIDTLRASVWFLRRGPQSRTFPLRTRVLVEASRIDDGAASIRRLIYQVNGCTARDAIEVRYQPRCAGDRLERPISHQVPVALLARYQSTRPVAMPGPSGDDMRTSGEASR